MLFPNTHTHTHTHTALDTLSDPGGQTARHKADVSVMLIPSVWPDGSCDSWAGSSSCTSACCGASSQTRSGRSPCADLPCEVHPGLHDDESLHMPLPAAPATHLRLPSCFAEACQDLSMPGSTHRVETPGPAFTVGTASMIDAGCAQGRRRRSWRGAASAYPCAMAVRCPPNRSSPSRRVSSGSALSACSSTSVHRPPACTCLVCTASLLHEVMAGRIS